MTIQGGRLIRLHAPLSAVAVELQRRHTNLWSQYDTHVVGQHGVLCEVRGIKSIKSA